MRLGEESGKPCGAGLRRDKRLAALENVPRVGVRTNGRQPVDRNALLEVEVSELFQRPSLEPTGLLIAGERLRRRRADATSAKDVRKVVARNGGARRIAGVNQAARGCPIRGKVMTGSGSEADILDRNFLPAGRRLTAGDCLVSPLP